MQESPVDVATRPLLSAEENQYLGLLSFFHFLFGTILVVYLILSFKNIFDISSLELISRVLIVLAFIVVLLIILAGHYILCRKHWLSCVIIAGLECIGEAPINALGILTLVVLFMPNIKAHFKAIDKGLR